MNKRRPNLLEPIGMPRPAPTVPRFYPPQAAERPLPPVPRRSRTRRVLLWLLRWGFIAAVWLTLAMALVVLWYARDLPRPEAALDAARRPSLVLEDRSGHVIATFGDVVGEPLRLKDFPPALPAAGGITPLASKNAINSAASSSSVLKME